MSRKKKNDAPLILALIGGVFMSVFVISSITKYIWNRPPAESDVVVPLAEKAKSQEFSVVIEAEVTDESFVSIVQDPVPPAKEKLVITTSTLRPGQLVDMSFVTKEMIESISVKPGQSVSMGTELVRQRMKDVQSSLQAKKAELEAAQHAVTNLAKMKAAEIDVKYYQSEYETTYKLWFEHYAASKAEVASKKRLWIQAKNALENAQNEHQTSRLMIPKLESEIAVLEATLDQRILVAPFNGEVGEIMAEVGQIVEREKVLVFFDLSRVIAICAISAEEKRLHPWWRTSKPIIEIQTPSGPEQMVGQIVFSDELMEGPDLTFYVEFENRNTNRGWLLTPSSDYTLFFENEQTLHEVVAKAK